MPSLMTSLWIWASLKVIYNPKSSFFLRFFCKLHPYRHRLSTVNFIDFRTVILSQCNVFFCISVCIWSRKFYFYKGKVRKFLNWCLWRPCSICDVTFGSIIDVAFNTSCSVAVSSFPKNPTDYRCYGLTLVVIFYFFKEPMVVWTLEYSKFWTRQSKPVLLRTRASLKSISTSLSSQLMVRQSM